MNQQPGISVSIILTVLNEGDNVRELLEALLSQSRRPDQIVIVDGGSRDDTIAIIEEARQREPLIRLLVVPGVNIAEGRNIAIAEASSEVVAVTDGGCRPAPDWLEEMIRPFEDDSSVDAVAGNIIVEGRSEFERCSGLLSTPKFDDAEANQTGMFYGRCSAFRKQLWLTVGGYPEWLYTAEDSLFALAAKRRGFKAVYAPAAKLRWRPRPNLRKTAKMFFLYGRGNGRIGWGSLNGTWYWMRFYIVILVLLVAAWWFPWAALGAIGVAGLVAYRLLGANRYAYERTREIRTRWLYIPAIIIARNFCSNLGYLVGHLEYEADPLFRFKLSDYLAQPARRNGAPVPKGRIE